MMRDICVIPIISLTSRRMRCSGRNDLFVGCDFPVECDGLKGRSKSTRGVRPRPRPGGKNSPRRAVPPRRLQRRREYRQSRRPDGDARPRHPAVRRRRRGSPGRGRGARYRRRGDTKRTDTRKNRSESVQQSSTRRGRTSRTTGESGAAPGVPNIHPPIGWRPGR